MKRAAQVMDITIKVQDIKELLKQRVRPNKHLDDAIRYKDDDRGVSFDMNVLNDAEITVLVKIVDSRLEVDPNSRFHKWLRGRLRTYFEIKDTVVTSATILKSVERLAPALKKYLEDNAPRRWVFEEDNDGQLLPYFVDDIQYIKRKVERGHVTPAHVTMTGRYYSHGSKSSTSWTWWANEFRPMTVSDALRVQSITIETHALLKTYTENSDRFGKLQSACGQQMFAIGDALAVTDRRWYSSWSTIPMIREGQATRVVLDPLTEEVEGNKDADDSMINSCTYWDAIPDTNGALKAEAELVEDEDEETHEISDAIDVTLPLHPYLYAFDLDKHQWVDIHVAYLQPYEWDKSLLEKLKLPRRQKDLLHVLMSTTGKNIGDIIRGKMQGTIVIATGPPGVGKTLTAEVFSEHIERPLYIVQCSQLGLNVDDIEKHLQSVLRRASRWGAVLLIDEADVYIRRRGEDIQQNAIVGVFLRLLEYYRGILFMASNRDEIIDDAILSRATAWIQYSLPDRVTLGQIWQVLSQQFKVMLDTADTALLLDKLPGISGRSVRNILKLATLLKGSKATVSDLITMSEYQALEKEDA